MFSSKRPRIRFIRRSKKHSQNAEAIANNYDLLIQILLCLPVKSLLRFKSVSKTWNSLISDPGFSRRLFPEILGLIMPVYSRFKTEYGFTPLANQSTDDAPFKFLDFVNHPKGLKVVQSCNGLLLCCSISQSYNIDDEDEDYEYYYIYNPTTKQFAMIPLPANQVTPFSCRLSLAFDPTKSPHYKVVCVRDTDVPDRDDSESSYMTKQIEVYSSQTCSWRPSGEPFIAQTNSGFSGGVFCNGVIHWFNDWRSASPYFNVEDEKVGELPMPPVPDYWEDYRRCQYFGGSRGHLHLVEIYQPPTSRFRVYEVESDYSGWFVKYNIDLNPLTVAYPGMVRTYSHPSDLHYYAFSILCFVREANDEDSYVVLHIPEKAIKYNLKDGSFNKICDLEAYDDWYLQGSPALISLKYFWADQFIQTLSPV